MEGAQEPMSVEEAVLQVGEILTNVNAMGANDSEPSQLQEIMNKLQKGEIKPAEALRLAHAIINSKASYH